MKKVKGLMTALALSVGLAACENDQKNEQTQPNSDIKIEKTTSAEALNEHLTGKVKEERHIWELRRDYVKALQGNDADTVSNIKETYYNLGLKNIHKMEKILDKYEKKPEENYTVAKRELEFLSRQMQPLFRNMSIIFAPVDKRSLTDSEKRLAMTDLELGNDLQKEYTDSSKVMYLARKKCPKGGDIHTRPNFMNGIFRSNCYYFEKDFLKMMLFLSDEKSQSAISDISERLNGVRMPEIKPENRNKVRRGESR